MGKIISLLALLGAYTLQAQTVQDIANPETHQNNQGLYEAELYRPICLNNPYQGLAPYKTLAIPAYMQYNLWKYVRENQPIYGYNELTDIIGMTAQMIDKIKPRLTLFCPKTFRQKVSPALLHYTTYTRTDFMPQQGHFTQLPKAIHQLRLEHDQIDIGIGLEHDKGERYGSFLAWYLGWKHSKWQVWIGHLYLRLGYGTTLWSGFRNKYKRDFTLYTAPNLVRRASLSDEIGYRRGLAASYSVNENWRLLWFATNNAYRAKLKRGHITSISNTGINNSLRSTQDRTTVHQTLLGTLAEWTTSTTSHQWLYTNTHWSKPWEKNALQSLHTMAWHNQIQWHRRLKQIGEIALHSDRSIQAILALHYQPEKFNLNTHLRYIELHHRPHLNNTHTLVTTNRELALNINLNLTDIWGNAFSTMLETTRVPQDQIISRFVITYLVEWRHFKTQWKWFRLAKSNNHNPEDTERWIVKNTFLLSPQWQLGLHLYLNRTLESSIESSIASELAIRFQSDPWTVRLSAFNHRINHHSNRIYIYEYGTRFSYPFVALNQSGHKVYTVVNYKKNPWQLSFKFTTDSRFSETSNPLERQALEVLLALDLD